MKARLPLARCRSETGSRGKYLWFDILALSAMIGSEGGTTDNFWFIELLIYVRWSRPWCWPSWIR
ncbi:hypothetical protein ACIPUB_19930 [Paeniglutamicibacter sp. ORCA_105]|uniref:hypothetical protein n=1 Tax=Paeniglutamicibacter sp. ORCA_105 TaxID=3377336 RepID=UPI003893AEC7